jgi:hypothetical protein
MMKIRYLLTICFILIISVNCNSKEYKNGDKLIITGQIALVGGEPFTRLVIRYDNKDFYLPSNLKKEFMSFLNQIINVEGIVKIIVLESADRKYKVTEYNLEKVKILKKK